ncbi:unnamed protein product, partial [Coregonus sp. 'balchen']
MTASLPNHPAPLTNESNASFNNPHLANSSTISLKKTYTSRALTHNWEKRLKEPSRVVFRRAPNISQMVVRSDLPSVSRSTFLDNVLDGKMKRSLKTRIAEHRSNIKTLDQRNPVAAHFMEARHNIRSLRYIGIEH